MFSTAKPRMLKQRDIALRMKAKQAQEAEAAHVAARNRSAASRASAAAEAAAAAEEQAKKKAAENAVASIINKVAFDACQAVVKSAAVVKQAEEQAAKQAAEAKAAREREVATVFDSKPKLLGAWATINSLRREELKATIKPGESKALAEVCVSGSCV